MKQEMVQSATAYAEAPIGHPGGEDKPRIPTRFVVVEVGWGEGRKHLYSTDSMAVIISFHDTEEAARAEIDNEIQRGTKMLALMEIKNLFVAKAIPFDEIS